MAVINKVLPQTQTKQFSEEVCICCSEAHHMPVHVCV